MKLVKNIVFLIVVIIFGNIFVGGLWDGNLNFDRGLVFYASSIITGTIGGYVVHRLNLMAENQNEN